VSQTVIREKGFTLIEIMIVVAIIAILAGIALPSYLSSVQKTRRTDAKEALTRTAALEERFFFTNNRYGDDVAREIGTVTTESGYYTVVVTPNLCDPVTNRCLGFSITATPVATGPQAGDTTCQTFSIDHTGKKIAKDKTNNIKTSECW
jgi:type IV pilus assembly protein PilE